MARAKKAAAKKIPKPKAAAKPKAAIEKDKEERPPTYRVDLGEALPPQAPPPTGTDKGK